MKKIKNIREEYFILKKSIRIADVDYNEDNMNVNRVQDFSFTR